MRVRLTACAIAAGFLVCSVVAMADAIDHRQEKLDGSYIEYSGSLDDMALPTNADAKISIEITGKLARDLYARLGKHSEIAACAPGIIVRQKKAIQCVLDKSSTSISCTFGLDIKSGAAISGAIC